MNWDLIGEDADAIYTTELLPLDWRTKAKACIAWGQEVDRPSACEMWATRRPAVVRGFECWAPPGEWYGGTYVTWADVSTVNAPPGWCWLDVDHEECAGDYSECDGRPDIVCLDARPGKSFQDACAEAPESVHLVSAGYGHEWLSRITRPCTVAVLR